MWTCFLMQARCGCRAVFLFLVMLAIVAFPMVAADAEMARQTAVPPEAATLYGKLLPKLQAPMRAWAGEQAKKLAAGSITVESLDSSLTSIISAGGLAGMDVSEAAFIVMSMATKDMDEDIKEIMSELKHQQEVKRRFRDLQGKVRRDVEKNAVRKASDPCVPPGCGGYGAELMAVSTEMTRQSSTHRVSYQEPKTVADLKPILEDLKRKLDDMDKLSEEKSLRLQTMMERRSKIIYTLINIMKRISTTSGTLIQNLK